VDWAQRVTVRQDKAYPDINQGLGIVWHSQEGYGLQAMINIANRDDPPSFMFWIAVDGALYQFSPVTASVWCSGNYEANTRYWPVESEGVAGHPLNEAQVRAASHLIEDWQRYTGQIPMRGVTMLEHQEVATRWTPNAGPTSCPSGRYQPLWEAEMPDPRVDKLLAALGGEAAVDAWNAQGNSLLVGYALEQAEQDQIDARLRAIEMEWPGFKEQTYGTNALLHQWRAAIAVHGILLP
jgi:hypothetical protein